MFAKVANEEHSLPNGEYLKFEFEAKTDFEGEMHLDSNNILRNLNGTIPHPVINSTESMKLFTDKLMDDLFPLIQVRKTQFDSVLVHYNEEHKSYAILYEQCTYNDNIIEGNTTNPSLRWGGIFISIDSLDAVWLMNSRIYFTKVPKRNLTPEQAKDIFIQQGTTQDKNRINAIPVLRLNTYVGYNERAYSYPDSYIIVWKVEDNISQMVINDADSLIITKSMKETTMTDAEIDKVYPVVKKYSNQLADHFSDVCSTWWTDGTIRTLDYYIQNKKGVVLDYKTYVKSILPLVLPFIKVDSTNIKLSIGTFGDEIIYNQYINDLSVGNLTFKFYKNEQCTVVSVYNYTITESIPPYSEVISEDDAINTALKFVSFDKSYQAGYIYRDAKLHYLATNVIQSPSGYSNRRGNLDIYKRNSNYKLVWEVNCQGTTYVDAVTGKILKRALPVVLY
jgi:hypothetical protein